MIIRVLLVVSFAFFTGCFRKHSFAAPVIADAGVPQDTTPPAEDAVVTDVAIVPAGCNGLGGVCRFGRWANCAAGLQPSDDLHSDCPRTDGRGDFCCVDAPPSTGADTSEGMIDCFPTAECEWCWAPMRDPVYSCAGGRVACEYVCLD